MSDTRVEPQVGEVNKLPSWRFHVEKLGCIESGDFEVKPLTLLCGPNNTGKTWAMYALYGFLSDTFSSPPLLPGIDRVLVEVAEKGVYSWDFGAWLETNTDELLKIINERMRRSLPEIFNSSESIFVKSCFDWKIDRDVFIRSGINHGLDLQLKLGSKSYSLTLLKPAGESKLHITLLAEEMPDLTLYLSSVLLNHLMGKENGWRVFLLPAERNGLHLFYKELAHNRTARSHPTIANLGILIIASRAFQYAKPIADYIDWLNTVPELLKLKFGQYQGLAKEVEAIVGGGYSVDAEGNVSFKPENSEAKLDFHLSSSTVKSLFGLWFFLAHQANPGDTLMIDEPELNLHPANQRALARVLVRLVNKGLRVVVSTHSDYIVREINNLIMMHTPFEGREELAKKFHYEDENSIGHERVAAYLFDGGTIKPMEVGPEEGVIAETFDEVINALNKSSNEIFYTKRDAVE